MVKPERRTRTDVAVAAAIAAIVAIAAVAIWWTSDARATQSRPADAPSKSIPPADAVPAALDELWSAPSATTDLPLVASGTVVTGDGSTVEGRDPLTGETRWSYARDRQLCGVTWVYQYAVAVYPDVRGCGQVSTIDSSTGRRGPARTGYADDRVRLSSDGTVVLSTGSTRLELWRSDMVRMIGFGEVDARVKPNQTGLGQGCAITSAAASPLAVSLLQACPGEVDVRLTLLRPGDEDDEPTQRDVPQPDVAPDSTARVLAVSDTITAVYLPTPSPRVSVVDQNGAELSSTPVPQPPSAADPATTVTRAGNLFTWWTGDAVLVFNSDQLTHKFTVEPADGVIPLGPATMMADRLLIPVTGGVGVYDSGTGELERVIDVDRPSMDSGVPVIVPSVVGPTVLEQRGRTVVALGARP
ncbi:hypothetical protein [Mycolicibacterium sp.]|uniref:Rv3212 family protein n=1 Tax=Mycolicibacterium sp. TaxID=2320850 RepID=UPI00355CD2B0